MLRGVEDSPPLTNNDSTLNLLYNLNLEFFLTRFMCQLIQDLKSTDTWKAITVALKQIEKKIFEKTEKMKYCRRLKVAGIRNRG